MAKISVIIPCYNTGRFVDKCMKSMLRQTYTDWEIIAVNDCSTDNTLSVLRKYEAKDKRIRVIDLDVNGGESFHTDRV